MSHVQIVDCTLRDGAYLLNKNASPEFVKGIMKGLVNAGIDFVETGFLQSSVTGESLVYGNSIDARRFLPMDQRGTEFLGFCDNSRYSPDDLDSYDGMSFKWLRISFAKHELEESLDFCRKAQKMGYTVQFNPMDSIGYTDNERAALIEKINEVMPGATSIVDTFGSMYLDDLVHIFKQMDSLLDKRIKIGLHSHDNLGVSNALAETMITLAKERERDIIVDGSLLGMGRGAGNAHTELLANYINERHEGNYNLRVLIDTIEQYILPLTVKWGYDLKMFICGMEHAHVDNVCYLEKKMNCNIGEMYEIFKIMTPSQKTRYGIGYNKNDFTDLQKAFHKYRKENET